MVHPGYAYPSKASPTRARHRPSSRQKRAAEEPDPATALSTTDVQATADTQQTDSTKRFVTPAARRRQHTARLRQVNARRQQTGGSSALSKETLTLSKLPTGSTLMTATTVMKERTTMALLVTVMPVAVIVTATVMMARAVEEARRLCRSHTRNHGGGGCLCVLLSAVATANLTPTVLQWEATSRAQKKNKKEAPWLSLVQVFEGWTVDFSHGAH